MSIAETVAQGASQTIAPVHASVSLPDGGPVVTKVIRKGRVEKRRRRIYDDADPGVFLSALAQAEAGYASRLYEVMLAARSRDSRFQRACQARNVAVSARDFTVEPADDSKTQKRIAAELDTMLRRVTNLPSILAELNDAHATGLVVAEHHWRMDGRYRVSSPEIAYTPLFRWDGMEVAFDTMSGARGQRICDYPAHKFIVNSPTNGFAAAPHRRGAMLPLIGISFAKRNGLQWWMSALERFGQPSIAALVGAPDGTSLTPDAAEDLRARAVEALEALSSEWVAAFDRGVELKGIDGAKLDSDLHIQFADWCNREIAIGITGHNLTTEVMQGSHAAANIARLVQADIAMSDIQHLEHLIREQWLRWLVQFNWPGEDTPFFRFSLSTPSEFTVDEYRANLCTEDEYRRAKGHGPKPKIQQETTAPEAAKEPLNGAQMQSALEVVARVARREIPRDSGIALLMMSLLVTEQQANQIIGQAGLGFSPAASEAA